MTVQRIDSPPRLPVVLARGALASRSKRGPYEGARLPGVRLVLPEADIDTGRLRAYARVCGFTAPDGDGAGEGERNGRGGGGGGPVPPSYPHIMGFPLAMLLMSQPAFPFPVLGLVHTGIELTQHRALRPGERPEISVHTNALTPHRRGSSFDVVTEARLGGRLVWHSRSTYLCRHRTADGERGDGARESAQREATGPSGATSAPHGPRPEPLTAPHPLPVRDHWRLPSGLGRRYARASGDRNPIHLHPLTAKLFGFPRHIAHGMWTFARALAATGAADGGEQLTARAEFKAPVLLPSTVAYGMDEPTAPVGNYRAPVRVHRFELRGVDGETGGGSGSESDGESDGGGKGGSGGEKQPRLHLTGEVTSERP
ncbi:acyl dehydratase [Streptomyces sp. Amel2xB2]|uniref:MaoC/PaaZ C-terminal domain-containing protein n=1 Tax=Streptomyces sp. Amel2xB2 TaxID=1305829 RepID=UPI000DBFFADA|nr:MaoC/PaaZ C-terminal domain-containing protein [Streptomyces sp. Amel2xB2]RAJ57312.1 acyl dehydratase [Streptomyces sp. Amel2xB2]